MKPGMFTRGALARGMLSLIVLVGGAYFAVRTFGRLTAPAQEQDRKSVV